MNPYWNVGFGVSSYERSIKNSELNNEVEYNSGHVSIEYTFY